MGLKRVQASLKFIAQRFIFIVVNISYIPLFSTKKKVSEDLHSICTSLNAAVSISTANLIFQNSF